MNDSKKSSETSEKLRKIGNEFYTQRKFHDALIKYNESACYAEKSSENLGNAYANRSAVYFETRLFDHAINNIKLAKKNGYPEENVKILKAREEKCCEMMKKARKSDEENFFKLSYKSNRNLPTIIDCLELKTNEKFGRHVITNKSLKVGDIIAHDTPYCSVLLSQSRFFDVPDENNFRRCSNCFKENNLDLVACENCCDVMFCSDSCATEAWNIFHRFECPVMNELKKSGSVHMSLKLFFTAFSTMNESIEELENFVKMNENSSFTVFDIKKDEEKIGKLKALISLMSSSKIFNLTQHIEILKSHPTFSSLMESNGQFIENFIQKMCQISDLNFHGIFSGDKRVFSENPTEVFKNLQKSIGSGAFLFNSLLNHSCANNVIRICIDRKIFTVVCQPIPKDAQIFDCYKSHFMQIPKPQRQAKLLKEFNFNCDCVACTENYPTPPALNFKDVKLLKIAKKSEDDLLQFASNRESKKIYQDCCEKLEKNYGNYPCIELCLFQKAMALFLMKKSQSNLFSD